VIRIFEYGKTPDDEIFERGSDAANVEKIVADIIENVKANKDKALKEYTLKFDKATLDDLAVSEEEIDEAFESVEPEFIRVLKEATENIRAFHSRQLRNSFVIAEKDGIVCGQRIIPIENVGIYVPGGTAPLSSTVLMDTIPAKIAGCKNIVMTTPPSADGKIDPSILAAAKIAGVDKIFKVGGAQAIAALAYGTETIPKVDKIVGVSIDMIAGPSDILVVADGKSDVKNVAADMLSQAEHDKLATAVLITDSMDLATKVAAEIEVQLEALPRRDIARVSIENNGKIIVAPNLDLAIEAANRVAPEHLELVMDDPFKYLGMVKNAGSVFMGRYCPEALGDYLSGANHTLPTNGTARFSSPLSVDDFIKKTQYTYYSKEALEKVYKDIALFAEKEGLHAHAKSATIRFEDKED
jgi:histidinol dehydrogenase